MLRGQEKVFKAAASMWGCKAHWVTITIRFAQNIRLNTIKRLYSDKQRFKWKRKTQRRNNASMFALYSWQVRSVVWDLTA